MRRLARPHMLFHTLLAAVGVVLLLTGSNLGLFLILCAVMMMVMMVAMGGHGGGRGSDSSGGRSHH
jgi:hypothetical protein